jgi:hypothetical protein
MMSKLDYHSRTDPGTPTRRTRPISLARIVFALAFLIQLAVLALAIEMMAYETVDHYYGFGMVGMPVGFLCVWSGYLTNTLLNQSSPRLRWSVYLFHGLSGALYLAIMIFAGIRNA